MPLVAAAICPHPPLLLPSVASGAATELDDLRKACSSVIDRVFDASPEKIILVGTGTTINRYAAGDFGSFDAYGVRETYALGGLDALAVGARMPESLAIGAWLLHARPTVPVREAVSVPPDTTAEACRALGAELVATDRIALIVMGDGTACRGEKSPGYADARAEPFDAAVSAALTAADADALLALDPEAAGELLVAGRAPWQVLAGAAQATGADWHGEVLYDQAPYGVAYFAASWWRGGSS
ncbi:MAG TPA: hypothetical protein VGJ28_11800 [Micromonosporaceae bacterium]